MLALATAVGTFVPGAHVHEDRDHHSTVAHRHLAAHDHDDHPEIADADETVIWLDDGCLHSTSFRLDAALAIAGAPFHIVRPAAGWIATVWYDAAPPHGPPRPALPARAPPLPA